MFPDFRIVVCMVYYGLALNSGDLGGDLFMNFFLQSLMDIPATVIVVVLLDKVGRKPLQVSSMIIGGVACVSTIFTIIYGGKGKNTVHCRNIFFDASFWNVYILLIQQHKIGRFCNTIDMYFF